MSLLFFKIKRPSIKGWVGEMGVRVRFWFSLDKQKYPRWHDLILELEDGTTTQVDHVVLSRFGVFVVETKFRDGFIFGREGDRSWTQVLNKRRKFSFQNPIRQNYRHRVAVCQALGVGLEVVHSVVVFVGGRVAFRKGRPAGVFLSNGQALGYMRSFTEEVFSMEQMRAFGERLDELKETQVSGWVHVENVRQRYAQLAGGICPRCGGRLVERRAKQGVYEGRAFWGCSKFPECRYTERVGGG